MFKVSPSLRPGPHLPSSPVPGFPAPWVPPDAFGPSLVSSSPRKPWPPTCRPPAQSWISRAWTSLTPGPILPVSTPQLQASPFPKPPTPPSLPASALPTGHVSSFRSPEPHPFSYHRASLFLAGGLAFQRSPLLRGLPQLTGLTPDPPSRRLLVLLCLSVLFSWSPSSGSLLPKFLGPSTPMKLSLYFPSCPLPRAHRPWTFLWSQGLPCKTPSLTSRDFLKTQAPGPGIFGL